LEQEGHEVLVVDMKLGTKHDLRDPFKARRLFEELGACDVLIHGAANIGGIGYLHRCIYETYNENIAITLNVLRYAKFDKIVYFSSSIVYECVEQMPLKEWMAEMKFPLSPYGRGKKTCEELVMYHAERHGVAYIIVRPFNLYPEAIDLDAPFGEQHVLPDLIRKIAIMRLKEVPIFGDGLQTRCFTHIDDFCNAFLAILEKENAVFNIANDEEYSIRDVATLIWELVHGDRDIKFKHLPAFRWDVRRRVPDISRLSRYYKPKISLREGLASWLRELGVSLAAEGR